jgi:3-hydroxyacyl-CoA dehydrogenase
VPPINSTTDLTIDGDIAVRTLDSPPVNALSAAVREGVKIGVEKSDADAINAITLICAGRTFIAGAEISEFGLAPRPPHLADGPYAVESESRTLH